jgi:hypothetical protein
MTQATTPQDRQPAQLLRPVDDVATALVPLGKGTLVRMTSGSVMREVALQEDVAAGHKFAVRALAAGLRVRKYGEFIGRTTAPIAAGAWVHVHNLATSARHDGRHERVLHEADEPAQAPVALGGARCHVGENPLYDEARDRLFWIDVRETPAIHAITLSTGAEAAWPMREDIGSIALAGDDRLLVALRSGFAFFDCGSGAVDAHRRSRAGSAPQPPQRRQVRRDGTLLVRLDEPRVRHRRRQSLRARSRPPVPQSPRRPRHAERHRVERTTGRRCTWPIRGADKSTHSVSMPRKAD